MLSSLPAHRWLFAAVLAALTALIVACAAPVIAPPPPEPTSVAAWSESERAAIASLALDSLPPLPPDPSNRFADDPAAATLGRTLFFDARLSASGTVSCASCHLPEKFFTDGRPLAQGEGAFARHTMSLLGAAWSPWLTWDGKADSLWSQALLPLENAQEHGLDRTAFAHLLARDHAAAYEAIFGALPPLEEST
ncbi:MAG: cytochrome-c peroxidase, partial [Caldilineaceae bacterium]